MTIVAEPREAVRDRRLTRPVAFAAIPAKATGRDSRRVRTAGEASATVVMELPSGGN